MFSKKKDNVVRRYFMQDSENIKHSMNAEELNYKKVNRDRRNVWKVLLFEFCHISVGKKNRER